jgi:uncharacterized BrkB/YihY/UPF0761 family membrane protein
MQFLLAIADAFYRTFGITEPTEAARRRAALYFLSLMVLLPIGIAVVVYLVTHSIRMVATL